MATLQEFVDQVQDAVLTISGIRSAPDEPPESAGFFPFVATYVSSGYWERRKDTMVGDHNVAVELHMSRINLPWNVAQAMAYAKSIPSAILAAWRDGDFDSSSHMGGISYTFGPMSWDVTDTVGFRFVIENVRTEDAIP